MTECSSCHAPIIWAKHHATGNTMPLNAEPSQNGKWHTTSVATLDGVEELHAHHGAEGGHQSHFATCPNAARHRTRRDPA